VLGLELKCRPDWLTNDGKIVVDLKTTDDASPRGFAKSISQWRYWVQAGFYVNVLEGATGIRPEQFIFCCVEKKAPYAVSVLAADQEMIEQGWRQALRELDVLATCKKANTWPGYSDQIETVSLPNWLKPGSTQQPPTEIEVY
jgi:exodeoxyribonuclease VIII